MGTHCLDSSCPKINKRYGQGLLRRAEQTAHNNPSSLTNSESKQKEEVPPTFAIKSGPKGDTLINNTDDVNLPPNGKFHKMNMLDHRRYIKRNTPVGSIRGILRDNPALRINNTNKGLVVLAMNEQHPGWLNDAVPDPIGHLGQMDGTSVMSFYVNFNTVGSTLAISDEEFEVAMKSVNLATANTEYLTQTSGWYRDPTPLPTDYNRNPPKQRDLNAWSCVNNLVKQHGGTMLTLLKEQCAASDCLFPYISKSHKKWKLINNGVPIDPKKEALLICANCGTPNIDCANDWSNVPRNGLDDPMAKVPFENPMDGEWAGKMRCGVCWFDLRYARTELPEGQFVEFSGLQINHNYIGTDHNALAKLMLTRDLTGALDDNKFMANKATAVDFKMVRQMIGRLAISTVVVPNGMSPEHLGVLGAGFKGVMFIQNKATPNPHALLAATRKAMFSGMMAMFSLTPRVVDIGGNRPGHLATNTSLRCMSPIDRKSVV